MSVIAAKKRTWSGVSDDIGRKDRLNRVFKSDLLVVVLEVGDIQQGLWTPGSH